jgi:Tfp pilus assembly protein PilZ
MLYEKIDACISSNPHLTPPSLAKKLNVSIKDIEQAISAMEGTALRKYLGFKRLMHALKIKTLNEKWAVIAKRSSERQRMQPRWIIPNATVRYLLYSHGIRKSKYSNGYPLKDIGREGMSFLADRPAKPGRVMSVLINVSGIKERLGLKGHVAYATPVDISSRQYCIGIQFKPFGVKPSDNPLKALEVFAQLEKLAAQNG